MKTKEQVTDVCRDKSSQINAINGEKTLSSKENVNTQHQKYQGADNMYTCEDCDFKTKQLKNLNGSVICIPLLELFGFGQFYILRFSIITPFLILIWTFIALNLPFIKGTSKLTHPKT